MIIRAYNKRGLELLWASVRIKFNTKEETLNSIYKTYGKEQWERRCNELNFHSYE